MINRAQSFNESALEFVGEDRGIRKEDREKKKKSG
jgi:hypothetical protein